MKLVERDFTILRIISKFRFCLGRQIKELASFTGERACDRRLKLLVDNGYLIRKKYLYGIPYLYTLTKTGKKLIGINPKEDIVRIDRIYHDILVVDSIIHFVNKDNISLKSIKSEKELNSICGFGMRVHNPDFVFTHELKDIAVEIELSLKGKDRLLKNVKSNNLTYDGQIWIVDKDNLKLIKLLGEFSELFSDINIYYTEAIKSDGVLY